LAVISLQSIWFAYPGGASVFEDFSWQVASGEAWAVLGPSGCGKTTLLYLLAGLRLPTSGEIRIGGEPLRKPRPGTGLILQDYGLLPWATVRENVGLGLRVRRFYGPDGVHAPSGERISSPAGRVQPWLERLGLTPIAESYPGQISGGQRQRTAIARTLALNPDLLLMDEPFASLDAPTREGLQALTIELRAERRLTTVVVTHAIEEAALLGQRILLLGSIPNTSAAVFKNPGATDTKYRGSPRYLSMCNQLRQAMEAEG
jgi:ABC-type nitrate/sulfonate/bicarbonate transport system ATPase subunit